MKRSKEKHRRGIQRRQEEHTKPGGPTEEEIRRRAYEIYLARGREQGHEQENWLQAERELRSIYENNWGDKNLLPFHSIPALQVPAITTEQMREVDHLMVSTFAIQILQLMENAGRNLAELTRRLLGGSVAGKKILVAVGNGNNGGGGMVAARHLYNWKADVKVLRVPGNLGGVTEFQWNVLTKLPIEKPFGDEIQQLLMKPEADVILDALIGYGLKGRPRGLAVQIIRRINELNRPVISLDVPSGLNSTTGEVYDPCVRAIATMTLALPKTGLLRPEARRVVGDLFLADIGVPDVVYRELEIDAGPFFIRDSLIRLEI